MKFTPFFLAVWRFTRVAIAMAISYGIAKYGHSDWYMTIAPAVIGASKWLREKYGIDIIVV